MMRESRVRSLVMIVVMLIGVGAVTATGMASGDDGQGSGQPNDKRPVYLDRSLHPTAADSCSPAFIWQGAGNPNTTFQRKRNLDAGVELGIKGLLRQGADIRSTYVDGDGLVHIEVPAGAQPGVANRAAWNFTYSYNAALDPDNPDLEEYDAELWIDLDPSTKAKYLKLTLGTGGAVQPNPCAERDFNGYQWYAGDTPVIPDDEGTRKVTQNSQNYAFYTSLIDTDRRTPGVQPYAFGPAQFDVVMALRDKRGRGHDDDDDDDNDGGGAWTILHVVFDVVNAPTQTP